MRVFRKILKDLTFGLSLSFLILAIAFPPLVMAQEEGKSEAGQDFIAQETVFSSEYESTVKEEGLLLNLMGNADELVDYAPDEIKASENIGVYSREYRRALLNALDAKALRQGITMSQVFDEMTRLKDQRIFDHIMGRPKTEAERQAKAGEVTKELTENGLAKAGKGGVAHIAESFRTIFFIWILTGIAIVNDEIRTAQLEGRAVDIPEIVRICGYAGAFLIDSGQIWSQLFGAGVMSTVMGTKPLQLMNALILDPFTNILLKQLLATAIHSTITFVGWELGGQLFTEATMMIHDESGYKLVEGKWVKYKDNSKYMLSQGVWSLSYKALAAVFGSDDPENKKARKVFGQLINNMALILFSFNDLTKNWIYNAWRLRIATGDFVSIVSCLTLASVIGNTLFPGAGLALGMAFGLVGAGAHVLTPQVYHDRLTFLFKGVRLCGNNDDLNENFIKIVELTTTDGNVRNLRELKEKIKYDSAKLVYRVGAFLKSIAPDVYGVMDNTGIGCDHEKCDKWARKFGQDLEAALKDRRTIRNRIMTIYFEYYYLLKLRLAEAENENSTIDQTFKKWGSEYEILDAYIKYAEEMEDLLGIKRYSSTLWKGVRRGKWLVDPAIKSVLGARLQNILEDNERKIEKYKKAIELIEDEVIKIYSDEESYYSELMNREDLYGGEGAEILLKEEQLNVKIIGSYLKQFIAGYRGDTAFYSMNTEYLRDPKAYIAKRKNVSLTEMANHNFKGFNEDKIIQRYKDGLKKAREEREKRWRALIDKAKGKNSGAETETEFPFPGLTDPDSVSNYYKTLYRDKMPEDLTAPDWKSYLKDQNLDIDFDELERQNWQNLNRR